MRALFTRLYTRNIAPIDISSFCGRNIIASRGERQKGEPPLSFGCFVVVPILKCTFAAAFARISALKEGPFHTPYTRNMTPVDYPCIWRMQLHSGAVGEGKKGPPLSFGCFVVVPNLKCTSTAFSRASALKDGPFQTPLHPHYHSS